LSLASRLILPPSLPSKRVYKYRPKGSNVFHLSIAQLDLYNGDILNTTQLDNNILNFTQVQLAPETLTTPAQLFGLVMYRNTSNHIVQAVARFTWGSVPKLEFLVGWDEAPAPNQCCEEAGKLICFHQAALETTSKLNRYYYPQCKKIYEWNTNTLETHHVLFEYVTSVVAYYNRIESILSGSLLSVVGQPFERRADIAVIRLDHLTATGVLNSQLETRVPLETSIDTYNGILYLLLGDTKILEEEDKVYADNLRLYAIDVLDTSKLKIISSTDLEAGVIYPDSLMNLCFQRLAESQDG
jgi:hypothetical protein